MIKKIVFTLLVIAALGNILGRVGILLSFKLNQAYIAAVLCINRDTPQMGCEGKCQLKQQMEKQDAQERNESSAKSSILSLFPPPELQQAVNQIGTSSARGQLFMPHTAVLLQGYRMSVFHPPLACGYIAG